MDFVTNEYMQSLEYLLSVAQDRDQPFEVRAQAFRYYQTALQEPTSEAVELLQNEAFHTYIVLLAI